MKINIIEIGNSQGIRLPKAIIEQCGFKDAVIAEIKDGKLILSSNDKPRKGWHESFKAMAKSGDDKILDSEILNLSSDEKDWQW